MVPNKALSYSTERLLKSIPSWQVTFIKNMQPTWQPGAGNLAAGCQEGKLSEYVTVDNIM